MTILGYKITTIQMTIQICTWGTFYFITNYEVSSSAFIFLIELIFRG